LQGTLTALSGKQIVPYLPKAVGSWLSGGFDSDRGVSRAVQEGLEKAFSTADKRKALWKIYKDSLVDYAEDAILLQTAQTLSDERTTSPDNAEAKQVRVASNAILMLLQLLQDQPASHAGMPDSKIAAVLKAEKMWTFSFHPDPHLRRSVYGLLAFSISNYPSEWDWTSLSTALLAKSLHISQIGSSRKYSEVLLALTNARPQIWTSDYTAKTSAGRRLFQFLKQGSQRGPAEFWMNVAQILRKVPTEVWQSKDSSIGKVTSADCKGLLQALLEGVSNSEEPPANAFVAWTTFIDLCFWAINKVADAGERDGLLRDFVSPLVSSYVTQSADLSQWALPSNVSVLVCSHYLVHLAEQQQIDLFEEIWSQQVGHLIDSVKLSLPETSKYFEDSQNSVTAKSNRFFVLETEVRKALRVKNLASSALVRIFQSADSRLLSLSLEILKTRNGKPYGASAIIAAIIPLLSPDEGSKPLENFLRTDLPPLLDSPSSEWLISILFLCRAYSNYPASLKASIQTVLQAPESQHRSDILRRLIKGIDAVDLSQNPQLGEFISEELELALRGDASRWTTVYALVQNTTLRSAQIHDNVTKSEPKSDLQGAILSRLLDSLSLESAQGPAMEGISGLLSTSGAADRLISESFAGSLLSKTLLLSDSSDEQMAERAKYMTSTLKTLLMKSSSSTVTTSTTDLIRDQFRGIGEPLSIFGLLELARDTFQSSSLDDKAFVANTILPTAEEWHSALAPFLSNPPANSTAITSPLQATVYIVDSSPAVSVPTGTCDAEGFSAAFRLFFCVTKLIKSTDLLDYVYHEKTQTLFEYLPQALELVNDKITLETSNNIWLSSTSEVLEEAVDVVADCRLQIKTWCELVQVGGRSSSLQGIDQHWLKQIEKLQETTPEAYHLGQAYTSVMSECVDINGPASYLKLFADELKGLRKSENLLRSGVLISVLTDALASSTEGKKLCNELIADATDLNDLNFTTTSLRPLMLLNMLLQGDDLIESIPTQRVVFLIKNLVRLLTSHDGHSALVSEAFKLLFFALPRVLEIYGDHWEQLLDFMIGFWSRRIDLENELATLHSSLKLYAGMSILVRRDGANEDLVDAWKASKSPLHTGLIEVLKRFDQPSVGNNQPRDVTARLLRRLLLSVDTSALSGPEKLYPLLTSQEAPIQCAAYELLHAAIPKAQAQVSLEIALEKIAVHLPAELLSLIVDTPKMQDPQGSSVPNQLMWNDMRRFLLAWNLVLDHFVNSSYKLKEMYVDAIKETGRLPDLLDLICDILGLVNDRAVDASKFNIESFNTDASDSAEKELQWLMIHLYYNCLLYLPSLTKDWFIQQKRGIKTPLENWTQKHFSPRIVSAILSTVTEWASTQDSDDRPITIKCSPKSAELTASITIDEESPAVSLSISLPGAYPLDQAVVTSRNRVGVSEKNWQSWLRTFQIIIFSTGSLIEGLIAFRKNVQGALKKQSECAICYSIIGTDMQTPNKKCGTCKNTYHGVCLYRWFKSSNSSSCPLCRNNFMYA
jgi:E3 ubiquitin-protein ligase listerin